MDDAFAEEARPGGLKIAVGFGLKPDLVLVCLEIRRAAQFDRWEVEEATTFLCPGAEDSELFLEIGMAPLKAANCFTAAA